MSTNTSTTATQRQQALQQLQTAFGQADGSMVFTYKGNVYHTVGTNADGSLQVINLATKQLTASLDPVEVYKSGLETYGIELDAPPPPPDPKMKGGPRSLDAIMAQAGQYAGFASLAVQGTAKWMGVANAARNINDGLDMMAMPASSVKLSIASFLRSPAFQTSLGALTAGLSAYSLYNAAAAFWKDPKASALLGLASSSLGVAMGVNTLLIATHVIGTAAATSGGFGASMFAAAIPIYGWLVAGGIILAPLIMDGLKKLFGWGPDPYHVAAQNLNKALTPVVWTAGPLLFVAAGTTALLMGAPKTAPVPTMASLTIPQSYATTIVGKPIPMSTSAKTPTIMVEKGEGTNPGRVIIVSPQGVDSKGASILKMESYALSRNFEFVSSQAPEDGYIPFFVFDNKGKPQPNPAVVKSLAQQESFLRAALSGGLSAQEALSALQLASVTNKNDVRH